MPEPQANKPPETAAQAAIRAAAAQQRAENSAANSEATEKSEKAAEKSEKAAEKTKKTPPENSYCLYLFQPMGERKFHTAVRTVVKQIGSSSRTGKNFLSANLLLGVHRLSSAQWEMIEGDPGCQDLLADRSLIKVAEPQLIDGAWTAGDNLATDLMDVAGTVSKITVESLIPQIFEKDLLEIAMNHLELGGFSQNPGSKALFGTLKDRLTALTTTGVKLFNVAPEHPEYQAAGGLQQAL